LKKADSRFSVEAIRKASDAAAKRCARARVQKIKVC
jgi:hypothetical protein